MKLIPKPSFGVSKFTCPVYQCGGLMVAKEIPYPKGKNTNSVV